MLFRKLAAGCALALLFTVTAHALADDNTAFVRDDDPTMLAAFAKARANLGDFLDKWRHPPAGTDNYGVKVGIQDTANGYAIVHANATVGAKAEFFWLADLHQNGNRFTAVLDNEPETIHNIRNGQKVEFGMDDIVDWMYVENDKIKGNFTACPALKNASAEERQEMADKYGLTCD